MLREPAPFDDPRYAVIVAGLHDLCLRHVLFAVWCDAGEIRVKESMWSDVLFLRWGEAEALIAQSRKQPGSESAIIAPERKKAC